MIVQHKPASFSTKLAGPNSRPNVKTGVKRKGAEDLTSLAKRRHSEVPNKAKKDNKGAPGILKRKSCIGSFDFTEGKGPGKKQETKVVDKSDDEVFIAVPATSSRRLSYTICEATSSTSDEPEPKAHPSPVAMETQAVTRNVRFQTPPNSQHCTAEHKKMRKTPKVPVDQRYVYQ